MRGNQSGNKPQNSFLRGTQVGHPLENSFPRSGYLPLGPENYFLQNRQPPLALEMSFLEAREPALGLCDANLHLSAFPPPASQPLPIRPDDLAVRVELRLQIPQLLQARAALQIEPP